MVADSGVANKAVRARRLPALSGMNDDDRLLKLSFISVQTSYIAIRAGFLWIGSSLGMLRLAAAVVSENC